MIRDRRWKEPGTGVVHAVTRAKGGVYGVDDKRQIRVLCSKRWLGYTHGPDVGEVDCMACIAVMVKR